MIYTTNTILDIIHRPVFDFEARHFEDWILSPSSGGSYSDGPNRKSYSLERATTVIGE
jgi:hypothetical protein